MRKPIKCASREIRRAAVVKALLDSNWDIDRAAKFTHESRRYVSKWAKEYKIRNSIKDKIRSGRKPKLSQSLKDTAAILAAEQQSIPAIKAALVSQHGAPADTSDSTVYRAVREQMQLVAPQKQPFLTAKGMAKRVDFANQKLSSSINWEHVLAIDSTYYTLRGSNPRKKVWVRIGHKAVVFKPNKSQQLHAYAGISAFGKTSLFYVSGTTGLKTQYTNSKGGKLKGVGAQEFQELLVNKIMPAGNQIFAAAGVSDWWLLLDNAPAHVAKSTKEVMEANGVKVIDNWPGNSPDLNPIENAWGQQKLQVYSTQHSNLAALKNAAETTWDAIPTSTLSRMMGSMRRRLQKVVHLKGAYTGY